MKRNVASLDHAVSGRFFMVFVRKHFLLVQPGLLLIKLSKKLFTCCFSLCLLEDGKMQDLTSSTRRQLEEARHISLPVLFSERDVLICGRVLLLKQPIACPTVTSDQTFCFGTEGTIAGLWTYRATQSQSYFPKLNCTAITLAILSRKCDPSTFKSRACSMQDVCHIA